MIGTLCETPIIFLLCVFYDLLFDFIDFSERNAFRNWKIAFKNHKSIKKYFRTWKKCLDKR